MAIHKAAPGIPIRKIKSLVLPLLALAGGFWLPQAMAQSDGQSDTKSEVAIYNPQNPSEQQAFDALEKGCARCHQDGRLEDRLKPAKGFGNVLQLDQMASDPNLVLPGNPDGSRLFQVIVNRDMPYDVYQEGDFLRDSPTADEVAAIRAWITALGETQLAGCDSTADPNLAAITSAVAADLGSLPDHRRANSRYITLTHLAARCASEEEMSVYRQAVVKLLNSLSRNSDVVRMETIDEAKTIIRFNLDDLDWHADNWEALAQIYPYGARPINSQFDFLQSSLHTSIPFVRGDWFAFFASRPPLYEQLLGLPDTFG
jgi:hypothetical protein